MSSFSGLHLGPLQYVHILDRNTNITYLEVGPKTLLCTTQEQVLNETPQNFIIIPPGHYCVIKNPLVAGQDTTDRTIQLKVSHGDRQVRLTQPPFPLFPGEELETPVKKLDSIEQDSALRILVVRDYERLGTDGKMNKVKAGSEYLLAGPLTYIPRVEEQVKETIKARVILPGQVLRVKARYNCVDYQGNPRTTGEEWLVSYEGAYLPQVAEEIVGVIEPITLTDNTAIHLKAVRNFKDFKGLTRHVGDEWLITVCDTPSYLVGVNEELVGRVKLTTLAVNQYCVVLDPVDLTSGKNRYGKREMRRGVSSFFLKPGERLEDNVVKNIFVLAAEEALLCCARDRISRELINEMQVEVAEEVEFFEPGQRWMIYGPRDFCPPVEVQVIELRRAIPLDDNEGVYVRDISTGLVRPVMGQSYLLQVNEVLWEKPLTARVEELLKNGGIIAGDDVRKGAYFASYADPSLATRARDKTRVILFRAPHNTAVQVYDYLRKTARVVFGPDNVILGPHEEFTVLSMSGGKPKRPNALISLALMLGPDYITDIFDVETADHARLRLQLSYNHYFDVNRDDEQSVAKIFNIPDYIGDASARMASIVRAAVASISFEEFHKSSARIIRSSIFGVDQHTGKICKELRFPANNLVITNVDVQAIDPIDSYMQESLQKSVQMAIEISTESMEAAARHDAMRMEQEALGRLELQKYVNRCEEEKERQNLLRLRTDNTAVQTVGRSVSEAQARSAAAEVEAKIMVSLSDFKSQAQMIEFEAQQGIDEAKFTSEFEYRSTLDKLEVGFQRSLATLEVKKFSQAVETIGPETLVSISQAGAEMRDKLLNGLGLKDFLLADSNSPLTMFSSDSTFAKRLASAGISSPDHASSSSAAHATEEWSSVD